MIVPLKEVSNGDKFGKRPENDSLLWATPESQDSHRSKESHETALLKTLNCEHFIVILQPYYNNLASEAL